MESFEWAAGVLGVVVAFEIGTSYIWLTVMLAPFASRRQAPQTMPAYSSDACPLAKASPFAQTPFGQFTP